jgi:hypothetical protein
MLKNGTLTREQQLNSLFGMSIKGASLSGNIADAKTIHEA